MKEKVQQRINQMKHLAKSPSKGQDAKASESFRANDNLSKSIRNEDEANVFLAELDAAVRVALSRKD